MNERKTLNAIYVLSAVVFLVVTILFMLPKAQVIPWYAKYLPMLNAFINGSCSVILLASYYCIIKKRISTHKKLNILAFILSSLFLVSYIWFHSFGIKTSFPSDNPLRYLYYFILITHIILAALVLPVVLISFYLGLTNQVTKHRKVTRWSFPVWLYVTVSGVVVYLMISPYYNF